MGLMPNKLKQHLRIKQQKDLLAVFSIVSAVTVPIGHTHVCIWLACVPLTCLTCRQCTGYCTLVQLLAYQCTPRVYLLYSYCRLVCACTILRVCSYIDTRVLVHSFACCCTLPCVCAEDSTQENFNLLMSGTVLSSLIIHICCYLWCFLSVGTKLICYIG